MTVGLLGRRIGKRYWRGSSAANSRPPRPRALLFLAKSQRYSVTSTPSCASLRCRRLEKFLLRMHISLASATTRREIAGEADCLGYSEAIDAARTLAYDAARR